MNDHLREARVTTCDFSDRFLAFMLGYCVNFKTIRYESTTFNRIVADKSNRVRLRLHGALRYRANLKATIYESTSLNRIVADKSHRVIVA